MSVYRRFYNSNLLASSRDCRRAYSVGDFLKGVPTRCKSNVPTFKESENAYFEKLNNSLGPIAGAGKPGRELKLAHGRDSES